MYFQVDKKITSDSVQYTADYLILFQNLHWKQNKCFTLQNSDMKEYRNICKSKII